MGTIALSLHWWRRPGWSYHLFMLFLCLGFLTIGASRFELRDRLRALRAMLDRARGDRP